MQQQEIGKGLFSMSNFYFVINIFKKKAFGIVYFYLHMFPISKTWEKVFPSCSLSFHALQMSSFLFLVSNQRHEHVFLITVDVLEGAVGFVAVLGLSDNCPGAASSLSCNLA